MSDRSEADHADFVRNQLDSHARWGSGALALGGAVLSLLMSSWAPFLAGCCAMLVWRYMAAVEQLGKLRREVRYQEEVAQRAEELEERVDRAEERLRRTRREHEELLLDIARGRAEVVPRGWGGVPLQPYLIVRHDEEEEGTEPLSGGTE